MELSGWTIFQKYHFEQYGVLDTLIKEQLPCELVVDSLSKKTMSEALTFAGIDSIDEARKLNLRIIPPGPVLHTWYGLFGTGIFDGDNNPPHAKGLNYVQRISDEATFLEQFDIPVIVVFLEKGIPFNELSKMHSYFIDHSNILLMSYEKDLNSFESLAFYQASNNIRIMDDMRFSLCKEFQNLLLKAQEKAIEVKPLVSDRIKKLGKRSIIYSDIDNTFFRSPLYQLSSHGFRGYASAHPDFSLQKTEKLSSIGDQVLIDKARRHRKYFRIEHGFPSKKESFDREVLTNESDSLYEYLATGEAFRVFQEINPLFPATAFFGIDLMAYTTLTESAQSSEPSTHDLSGMCWYFDKRRELERGDVENKIGKLLYLQQLKHLNIGCDQSHNKKL